MIVPDDSVAPHGPVRQWYAVDDRDARDGRRHSRERVRDFLAPDRDGGFRHHRNGWPGVFAATAPIEGFADRLR